MAKQHTGVDLKQKSLAAFFEAYLLKHAPYAINVVDFFRGKDGHQCSSEEFVETLKASGFNTVASRYPNSACEFIDWVIDHYFQAQDDNGKMNSIVSNPLSSVKRQNSTTETVRNPLPYRFIQDLRQILCP